MSSSRHSLGTLASCVIQQTVAGQAHLWCHPADCRWADSPLVSSSRQSLGTLASCLIQQTVIGHTRLMCHPADSRWAHSPHVSSGRQSLGTLASCVIRQTVTGHTRLICYPAECCRQLCPASVCWKTPGATLVSDCLPSDTRGEFALRLYARQHQEASRTCDSLNCLPDDTRGELAQ